MPTVSSRITRLSVALACCIAGSNAAAQALEVESSITGAPRDSQQLYGSDAIAAGELKSGAAAGNVLLPALRDIPKELTGQAVDTSGGLSASAWARLAPGSTGVYTQASAAGLLAVGPNDPAANYLASTSASARYYDTIKVGGSGMVDLLLEAEVLFDVDERKITYGYDQGAGTGTTAFYARIDYSWSGNTRTFLVCTWSNQCSSGAVSPGLHEFEEEISVLAGTNLYINTSIWAISEAGLYNPIANSLAGGIANSSVSSWQSLRNGITVLTPDASLSAASGHDYVFRPHEISTPMPEPGTLALIGIGLATLVLGRRRRAQAVREDSRTGPRLSDGIRT